MSTASSSSELAARRWTPPGRLGVHALISAASFSAYIAARLTEGAPATLLMAFGVSACGWAWLLARALFDPAAHDARWPRIVVLVLTVCGAVSVLAPAGGVVRMVAGNAYAIAGSAALVMTFIEAFQARGALIDGPERRFRAAFLVVYSVLMGVSVLGAWQAQGAVEVACAVTGLISAGLAVAYRTRRPLKPAPRPPVQRRPATDEDARLAGQIVQLFEREGVHAEAGLKIGDLAARLGQPEHRLSHCITAQMGFANFNRLINHYRIEQARRLLTEDPRRPILLVAFDCGFASVGPFNRAFKEATSLTPSAYRARAR